ncbi:hypothetical protein FRC17_001640 [Serendipita sp. 399]|nr:hypothetical protein FRC17_001640 [Serendipita sp. 399]
MLMASRVPHIMDATNLRNNSSNMDTNEDEDVIFNPAEHKDLAHFFSQVDQTETFALTANEWLGIRSQGQQFSPVGSVGPAPAAPNPVLLNATRSLMALTTPVVVASPTSASGSASTSSPSSSSQLHQNGISSSSSAASSSTQLPSTSPVTTTSIRAWRPHETPFDPSVHGGRNQHQHQHQHQHSHSQHHRHPHPHHHHHHPHQHQQHEHDLVRRSSSSSSSNMKTSHRSGGGSGSGKERSGEETGGHRKRPAHAVHADSLPSKRARSVSHSQQQPHLANLTSSTTTGGGAGGNGAGAANAGSSSSSTTKPPLLTAQQKKANHILSEQKRRAKIRRGYDALCEVVPALRSAVLAELEASDSKKKRGKSKANSSAAAAAAAAAAANDADGRAGPKSESVVLSQTIEYIEHLVARKEELLARLYAAQNTLPPTQRHPLNPESGPPAWEKEWDGGTGVEEGENDEDEDEDEEDEDTA